MNLKKKIITLAKSLGIEILRIADPLILKNTLDHKLSLLKDNKIPESEKWFIENIIRSVNPALHIQVVKSVIVCALPVNNADKNIKYPFAKIAPFARCDYYCHLKEKLKKIAEQIKKNFRPDLLYKVFSNGPLSEKPFAQISGLGFYGKNSIIYTKKYGSFIVLGLMLTNMDLKPDKPLNSDCGECEICIRSCPVNAIEKPYVVNHSKCIQYIMEKDVEPDMNILEHFRNSFYGCAICQDVCPRNKSIKVRKKYPDIGKC